MPGSRAQREEIIELIAAGDLGRLHRRALKEPGGQRCTQINNQLADGHAAARAGATVAEHTQWQVLQRKIGVTIGRRDPAAAM
ncbi:LysR family transcriptional regulator [Pseudomonas syringae pv. spinaceae]|uniref:LysR family transcriptional regulator n=1 Tax=Pseudomonas syringae pv. spinaceae TaxID=264459 RepID=A0A0Q0FIU0_PSESX|nr:LysR family transcriptional regulator [Pseudomonas syringae pv. spinaceae]